MEYLTRAERLAMLLYTCRLHYTNPLEAIRKLELLDPDTHSDQDIFAILGPSDLWWKTQGMMTCEECGKESSLLWKFGAQKHCDDCGGNVFVCVECLEMALAQSYKLA